MGEKTADKLLKAAIGLLKAKEDGDKITAREIVAEAGVNLAMINYCFGSKDQLINEASGRIIEDDFKQLFAVAMKEENPKVQLEKLLIGICETVFKYEKISRMTIPYLLLEAKIEVPEKILPLVEACFEGSKSDVECRLIAYQIVSFLQLIFYQKDHFKEYTGVDINNIEEREKLIKMQMKQFFY